jgi:hypothetical protein
MLQIQEREYGIRKIMLTKYSVKYTVVRRLLQ